MKAKVWLLASASVVLSCLVGWAVSAQTKAPARTVWEYKYLRNNCIDEKELNALGAQGWELVDVQPISTHPNSYVCPHVYLKRPK